MTAADDDALIPDARLFCTPLGRLTEDKLRSIVEALHGEMVNALRIARGSRQETSRYARDSIRKSPTYRRIIDELGSENFGDLSYWMFDRLSPKVKDES